MVVHPQSIVHSMVTLVDGSTIAQASPPDMRHAIGWALAHPEKLPGLAAALDFSTAQSWTFEPVDEDTFDAITLARAAHREGGGAMAVYNAVNEEAVEAFFTGSLSFLGITALIREVLEDPRRPRAQRVERGRGPAGGGGLGARDRPRADRPAGLAEPCCCSCSAS